MREVPSRYSLLIFCKILNPQLLLQWYYFRCEGLEEVVCKLVNFEVIILTCISILTQAVARRCTMKNVFSQISLNS